MSSCTTGLWCIVPAAGRGSRFGAGIAKQHVLIGERSLLGWTLRALAASPRIAGIVVVVAAGDEQWKASTVDLPKVELRSAIGGDQRADSVLAGLAALPDCVAAEDFVLVHDAARPCLHTDDIDALIERASQLEGGLLAAPVRDTLKRADGNGQVLATEPREANWRALTPQMFRREALTRALTEAREIGVVVTDESMAMEHAGHRPLLVEGREDNIKVTTPSDHKLAAFLLGQQ